MSNAANSLLSPINLIGADKEHNDRIAAAIDNLVNPVRDGRMTARKALENLAKVAFQAGFDAGHTTRCKRVIHWSVWYPRRRGRCPYGCDLGRE